jgi:hypothetical protein
MWSNSVATLLKVRPDLKGYCLFADMYASSMHAANNYQYDEVQCERLDEYVEGYMPLQSVNDQTSFYRYYYRNHYSARYMRGHRRSEAVDRLRCDVEFRREANLVARLAGDPEPYSRASLKRLRDACGTPPRSDERFYDPGGSWSDTLLE